MWKKSIIFVSLVLLFSMTGTFLSTSADEIREKYTFKIGTNVFEYQIAGKTGTSKFVHPLIIKEDRSMLDTRIFNMEVLPFFQSLYFESSGIPHISRCLYCLSSISNGNKNEIEMEILITFYPNSEIVKECKFREYVLLNDTEKLKFPVMPIYKGNETLQKIYSSYSSTKTHLLLPLRFIFETFGYTVEWNNDTREITVYK